MQEKDLRSQFFIALSRLKGWDASVIEKENNLEVRAIADKFIFQELPEEDKDILVRRAKTHRMLIPLTIDALKTNEKAEQQIISIITLMEASDTWEEFEQLQNKRSKNKTKPVEEPQAEEPLTDFDKILLGIMSVPKSDLDKLKEDGK